MHRFNRGEMRFSGILASLLMSVTCLSGQTEYDREFRVHESSIHQDAHAFIDSCGLKGNVKWYKEYKAKEVFLEAKTRKHGKEYSIEFDTLGMLKDVELTIQFEEIPALTQGIIRGHLESLFSRYRIVKTQYQWTGEKFALLKLIQHHHTNQPHTTHYEIILVGKRQSARMVCEVLFDRHGALVEFDEIPPRNTDHLDF